MPSRQGYDLSNLSKIDRPRERGPVRPNSLPPDPDTSSASTAGDGASQDIREGHITPESSFQSLLRAPNEPRPQPSRLSPGYTRRSGHYSLYNEQTGRGWRRSDLALNAPPSTTATNQSSPGTTTAATSNHENVTFNSQHPLPSLGVRDGGVRKPTRRVDSVAQRAARLSHDALAARFLTPPYTYRQFPPLPGPLAPGAGGISVPALGPDEGQPVPSSVPQIRVTSPSDEEGGEEGEREGESGG